jgi:5-methylcytosine-specific restriction protein A
MPVHTACAEPGCPGFAVPNGRGRCARHQRSEAQRGYGRDWRRIRRIVRAPTCEACGTTADLTVDHITPQSLGGTHALANLRTLCRSCHGRIGAQSNRPKGGGVGVPLVSMAEGQTPRPLFARDIPGQRP